MTSKHIKQDLQLYLIQQNCGEILNGGPKTDGEMKTLMKHLHAYLSTQFEKVGKDHIALTARTVVILIPSLSDETKGENAGFESYFICFLSTFK